MVWAESGRRYDESDLELAEELGRRAAVAIDNARLFRERSHVARTLQQSLLPPELPQVPGVELGANYHAAEEMEVGGDFYDVFDTGDGGWGVVMGDVCGRGADAAALTALARYTVRAAAMQDRRPSTILRTLNEAIVRQRPDYSFATVAYLRLRPDGDGVRVTVATGGHPLPLLLRRDGTVEEAGSPGTLLGVFEDPELTDVVVQMSPGDAILLYTDGVTESRGDGPIYGEERLKELLATCAGAGAQQIADRIEADVVAYQPNVPDDIAILALRVRD
jgi:serine phosphatase RsbU (regulator of sigma subunit)